MDQLIQALVDSKNEAADDVLLEALRLGSVQEKTLVLAGLIRRRTARGLAGVIGVYDTLPEPRQIEVLQDIRVFYSALRECARIKADVIAKYQEKQKKEIEAAKRKARSGRGK